MPKQRVGIVAECGCDLPRSYLREHNVDVLYFVIETDSGVFSDTDEISADNLLQYMQEGGVKSQSSAPAPEVYRAVFEKKLTEYDEVVHIGITGKVSASVGNSLKAVEMMGENARRIHVFDSEHLSTGMGHLVIAAIHMAEEGASAEEIVAALDELKTRVSTTFITQNADYLYRSGRVPYKVKQLCDTFHLHPILSLRGGAIKLHSVEVGNYEKALSRYVRKALRKPEQIDCERIFITHVGCKLKQIDKIKEEVLERCPTEKLIVTHASATVSSSCGPGTLGVLFVRRK